jgi:hypothetical protein
MRKLSRCPPTKMTRARSCQAFADGIRHSGQMKAALSRNTEARQRLRSPQPRQETVFETDEA